MAPTTRFLQPHRSRGDSPGCRPLPALATGAWGAATADNVPSLSAFHEDESDIFLKIRRKEKSSCSVNAEILGEFFLVFLKEYYQPCSYSKNHLPTVGASLFRQWLRPFPAASVCEPCLKGGYPYSSQASRPATLPAASAPSQPKLCSLAFKLTSPAAFPGTQTGCWAGAAWRLTPTSTATTDAKAREAHWLPCF